MLRVGLVGLICLNFCSCKKLATPLEFAESQLGVQEGSPSVWRYFLAVPDRPNVSETNRILAYALSRSPNLFGWNTGNRSDQEACEAKSKPYAAFPQSREIDGLALSKHLARRMGGKSN